MDWIDGETYTAWQLGADWSWMDGRAVQVVSGRTLYDTVNIGPHEGVRLERVSKDVRGIVRYVPPDTKLVLVRVRAREDGA